MSDRSDGYETDPAPGDTVEPPESITCVDCGGRCGLLSRPHTDDDGHLVPYVAGDVVAYRCADCLDRWDMVLE